MPNFSGPNVSGPDFEPTLDEIRRSDDFIDALATGRPATTSGQADAALAALLGDWRDGMRWPPETGVISEQQAIAALDAGLAEKPSGVRREKRAEKPVTTLSSKRNRRGLSVIGAAAAAVLCVGGFGAVVAGSGPGDSMYGLRTMLFGAPKQVRDDRVALAARTELRQVQQLISQGDWQQAQEKLVAVSTQVAAVGDETQKQQLMDQFNDLSAKVVERDPEATAPPGITYTVPPSATELVPALAPVTTTPTSGEATTPATSSEASATDSPESSSPSSSLPSSSASETPASSSAPTTASSQAASSASSTTQQTQTSTAGSSTASSTPSTAASSTATSTRASSTATTTPTSAAPTTSASPASQTSVTSTSAAVQATSSATSAAATTTSAAPKAAAETTTTAAPAVTTTAAPVVTTTAAPVVTTTAAPVVTTTAAPVTTTAVSPALVPAG